MVLGALAAVSLIDRRVLTSALGPDSPHIGRFDQATLTVGSRVNTFPVDLEKFHQFLTLVLLCLLALLLFDLPRPSPFFGTPLDLVVIRHLLYHCW